MIKITISKKTGKEKKIDQKWEGREVEQVKEKKNIQATTSRKATNIQNR